MSKGKVALRTMTLFVCLIMLSTSAIQAQSIWGSYTFTWVDHVPNPRFAIYDPGTPLNDSDDVVLDKETGLVWARDANLAGTKIWLDAIDYCSDLELGNRKGWRLPTVGELSNLIERSQVSPPRLPTSHPFIGVEYDSGEYYLTFTTDVSLPHYIRLVWFREGTVGSMEKISYGYVWPVFGGNGHAASLNW